MTDISTSATGRALQLRRPPAIALAAAFVCGVSAWVTAGRLAAIGPSASLRVGLLPPWWVPVLAAGAILTAALFLPITRRAWQTLFLPGVLLLAWLPLPIPAAFLLWTGPVAAWVWAVTAFTFVWAAWPRHDAIEGAAGQGGIGRGPWLCRAFTDPHRAPFAAFGLAFVLYCGAAWQMSPLLPGGDSPHYLVITQSLLKDGDLRIENNHQRGDYREFFSGSPRPHYLKRGKDGQIYSIHAPGLPALLVPAFAAGGYLGVVVFLALVASLGGALLWGLAFALTRSVAAAWFGWAAICGSAPFFVHAFQVFPDATGAVLALAGVAALVRLATRPGERLQIWLSVASGAALALLPWLHTRYAVVAAALGLAIGLRLLARRAFGQAAAFAAVPIASAAAWFGFFFVVYGTFDPTVPYGGYTQSSAANIPRGLTGLLFDQQFGLLPYAPAYAVALAGVVPLVRRFPRLAIELTVVAGAYLAAVATYHMWWGGYSAPARFAVPVLLTMGVFAAAGWAWLPRVRGGSAAALAATWLITISLVLPRDGQFFFNDRQGFAAWLQWLSPLVDLPVALPTLFRGTPLVLALQIAAWLLAAVAGVAGIRAVVRTSAGDVRGRLAVVVPWVAAVVTMCGATGGWAVAAWSGPIRLMTPGMVEPRVPADVHPVASSFGQLEWLRAFDPAARPIGVTLGAGLGLELVEPAKLVPRLRLAAVDNRPLPPAPALVALNGVPAGTYRLVTTPEAARGTLRARIGRQADPVAEWSVEPFRAVGAEALFHLPADVVALTMAGDEEAVRSIQSVVLQPVSVLPFDVRRRLPPARRAIRHDLSSVYTFDDNVYLEPDGLWVKGGLHAMVGWFPHDPGPRCRLLVRNGAAANTVTLESGTWQSTLRLQPHGEQIVDLLVDPAIQGTVLKVGSEGGFTPAKMHTGSGDQRFLGVWVKVLR